MSHAKPVVVQCSLGYREQPFKTADDAQRWIDNFEQARQREPRLCPGEHTVREEPHAHEHDHPGISPDCQDH